MKVTLDLQLACEGVVPEEKHFQSWVDAALAEVSEDCELSVRLVEVEECAELNSNYRGKTGPTNVLSFPFEAPIPMDPRLLGDLVICRTVVESEAQQQNKVVNDHWAHMVIHGCLHLLGYDHIKMDEAEQMETLEKTILQSLNIDNPYRDQESNI